MDFTLTEEQQLLVTSARQFVKKSSPVERFRRLRDESPGFEMDMWQQMAELGWLMLPFSEEDGGLGGSLVDVMLLTQELSRALVPEPYLSSVVLAGMTIAEAGTAAQKEALLAPMISGQTTLALAFTERRSRYATDIVETVAKKDGDGYRIDGEKVWVLGGHAADHTIVSAKTDDGVTLFVVPRGADGFTQTAAHGHDGRYTGWLKLEGVKVGADAVLGGVGDGVALLDRALDRGSAVVVAEGVGLMRELGERTLEHLRTRKQFGVPIGAFQALQHRAADMYIETVMTESMAILAAVSNEPTDVAKARVQLADGGWFVAKESIQLHGGIGCTDELDVGLYFKRMRVLLSLFGDRAHHLARVSQA